MSTKVELSIPRSTSPNLRKVLAMAQTFKHFSEPKDKARSYQLVVGGEELCTRHRDMEELYLMSRGWKGTQLRVNGRLCDMNGLRTVLTVFQCADQRSTAVIPETYCQPKHEHGWGCKRLTMIQECLPRYGYELEHEYGYWFQFGSFKDDQTTWNVDKKRLLEAITREAESKYIDICPFFNLTIVEKRVEALPDVIELEEESSWVICYEEKYNNSTIQKLPIGIKPKQVDDYRSGGKLSIFLNQDDEEQAEQKNRNIPEVSFHDIGGVDEIIGMIREVIELPLKHAKLIKHLGIAPHKGILLYGPPGCGKTLIAKAIANEIEAHFISVRGPELFTKWFGESEENLRNIFQEARNLAPSIIFFDEIDAIAQKRSGEENLRHESVFVNQLLTLMDGMEKYENVCVIASTNRPELLDDAIMRPGRFDYTLEVKHPSAEGCRRIFQIHTRTMPLASSVEVNDLASRMSGFTGAEISFVAREGAYNCLRRCATVDGLIKAEESEIDLKRFQVVQGDFEKALDVVIRNHKKIAEQ